MKALFLIPVWLWVSVAYSQLAVTVAPPKVAAQKAAVPLVMSNGYPARVESARAVVFLLDDQGKVVGQSTRWVIGGDRDKAGLPPGATNAFNFVVAMDKPVAKTNLTAKVSFSRVVLEGGRLADVAKGVQISSSSK